MERLLRTSMLLAAVFSVFSLAPQAQEAGSDVVVISTGLEGGGYWSAGERLRAVAEGLDFEVRVEASQGSLNNLQRLLDPADEVNLALAQADALQYHLDKNPGSGAALEVLENIGQECVFILSGSSSSIRTDADLHAGGSRLGISSPDSGIAVTWEYMKTLTPELANTTVVYTDTSEAMVTLNAQDRLVDAVMLVHRPKAHSSEVDRAMANLAEYNFVKMRDPRLSAALPSGDAVYQALDLAMPRGGGEGRHLVKTICVKGLLLANRDKLSTEQRGKLTDVVNYHWMRVYDTGG